MKKYELFLNSFYDHTGIVRHLEAMAEKGWLLEKTGVLWTYRKGEKEPCRYAVTYYPSSPYDPSPSDKEYLFRDLCSEAGWELIARAGQMQIFRAARPDPVPLDTEPMVQVETIHASMKSSHLKSQALLALVFLFQAVSIIVRAILDPLSILMYTGNLFSLTAIAAMLVFIIWETTSYFRWHKAALAAAKEGRFLPTHTKRWPYGLYLGLMGVLILSMLAILDEQFFSVALWVFGIIAASLFLSQKVANLLKAKGVSAKKNMIITSLLAGGMSVVLMMGMMATSFRSITSDRYENAETYRVGGVSHYAYHDTLPLYMGDIADADSRDYSNRLYESGSLLMKKQEVSVHRRFDRRDDPAAPVRMSYTRYLSPLPFMLELAVEDRIDFYTRRSLLNQHYEPITAASGAMDAWQLYDEGSPTEQYLLHFEGCVIEISFDFPPTAEQMATAIEKLLPA